MGSQDPGPHTFYPAPPSTPISDLNIQIFFVIELWVFFSFISYQCLGNRQAIIATLSPCYLIRCSFVKIFLKHLHSQTIRARVLKFLEKVHFTPLVTCHVSHVPCPMSHVIFLESGEASLLRVWYHWGLYRLVYLHINICFEYTYLVYIALV